TQGSRDATLEAGAQGHAADTVVGAAGEDLVDLGAARFEVHGRGGHVQAPDAGPGQAHVGDGRVPVGLEVGDPLPQGEGVVLAQALEVPDLEARVLDGVDDRAYLVQLAVGKDVAVDEAGPRETRAVTRRAADGVVQEPA